MEPVGNSTPVAPSDMGALEHRVAQRRRRRARAWAAAVVTVVLVAGTVGVVEWTGGHATERTPAIEAPATRPPTTVSRDLALGIPAPTRAREQVQVPWGAPFGEPLALGYGRVWVGNEGGAAILDPASMKTIATVAIELPVLSIASSPDGVWILSGSNGYPRLADESDLPPYHLTRIDPADPRRLHLRCQT